MVAHFQHQNALVRGNPSDPLFQFGDGEVLTYSKFLKIIVFTNISGHSFRKGGATALLRAGAPIQVIMAKGNWKSYDSMDRYMARTRSELARYSGLMK